MEDMRNLIRGNEDYPPSEDVWRRLCSMIMTKRTKDYKLKELQYKMEKEINKYKPSLPEPELAKFNYKDRNLYLDAKGKIYEMDINNPTVGNLVGEIRGHEIYINNDLVHVIPEVKVTEKEMYEQKYYIDDTNKAYRGLHPKHKYIYVMGRLNKNKLDII